MNKICSHQSSSVTLDISDPFPAVSSELLVHREGYVKRINRKVPSSSLNERNLAGREIFVLHSLNHTWVFMFDFEFWWCSEFSVLWGLCVAKYEFAQTGSSKHANAVALSRAIWFPQLHKSTQPLTPTVVLVHQEKTQNTVFKFSSAETLSFESSQFNHKNGNA